MSILIDVNKRVLVQGITGREGIARTRLMAEYGTDVVAGVTPGKGGQIVLGVPVFDTVNQAIQAIGKIDMSVLFVPAPLVKAAAIEAIMAGIQFVVIIPDRVPLYDVIEIAAVAKTYDAQFIGPNSLGILSPGEAVVGMMGGRADSIREWAVAGNVGITSRSGGVSTSMAYYLSQAGHGLSTVVHVGGDSVVGMTHADVLQHFQRDKQTEVVVMFGEIGTSQEEDAAALIRSGEFTKPMVAYIGGKAAKEGMRFSHAGAIIEGDTGTHQGKVQVLQEAGVIIAESFMDIPKLVSEVLAHSPPTMMASPKLQSTDTWYTAITDIRPNSIRLRGHTIESLMENANIGQVVYLALTGEMPSPNIGRMIQAILVSCVDHGVVPPSTVAARTSASTGAPINAALAAGLLSINEYHGGAIENCMRMFSMYLQEYHSSDKSPEACATEFVQRYRDAKRRLPGYGHRIHTADPRATKLLELAAEENIASEGVQASRHIYDAIQKQLGRTLPLNIDGAIAAVLWDMQIDPGLGNTFFMMSRVPGLVAHIQEERLRHRPMRRINPYDAVYRDE